MVVSSRMGRVLRRLLPPGRLFGDRRTPVLDGILEGLGAEFDRVDAEGAALAPDLLPTTSGRFLEEWERTLGLPDECGPAPTTTSDRLRAVRSRLLAGGDLSRGRYLAIARTLGYEARITEGAGSQFRCGISRCGDDLGFDGGEFLWTMTVPAGTTRRFECGVSRCGDPLADAGDELLECLIERAAPAHTAIVFVYAEVGDCLILLLDENGATLELPTTGVFLIFLDETGAPLEIPLEDKVATFLDEDGRPLTLTATDPA